MSGKTVTTAVLAPLINFVCWHEPEIAIDETTIIRQYSFDEIDRLLRQLPKKYYLPLKLAIGKSTWVLETKQEFEEEEGAPPYIPISRIAEIDKIVTAFRLLKMNAVEIPIVFYVSADSVYVSNPSPKLSNIGNPDSLGNKGVPEFVAICKALLKVEENKPYLEFALFQLNRAIVEDSTEIKYTDIIAAFESIVFGRVKNAPSPYGLALGIGIGMLLGKSERERSEIEQKINSAYETRNLVVHGHLHRKLKDSDYEKHEEALEFALNCLRLVLIKLLLEENSV